jgi:hypothetical protein
LRPPLAGPPPSACSAHRSGCCHPLLMAHTTIIGPQLPASDWACKVDKFPQVDYDLRGQGGNRTPGEPDDGRPRRSCRNDSSRASSAPRDATPTTRCVRFLPSDGHHARGVGGRQGANTLSLDRRRRQGSRSVPQSRPPGTDDSCAISCRPASRGEGLPLGQCAAGRVFGPPQRWRRRREPAGTSESCKRLPGR